MVSNGISVSMKAIYAISHIPVVDFFVFCFGIEGVCLYVCEGDIILQVSTPCLMYVYFSCAYYFFVLELIVYDIIYILYLI